LEELRKDEDLRRALAEELLPETLRHRELRRTILLALSKEMATKEDIDNLREDIENLRRTTKEDIENLRRATKEDIDNLREDIENLRRTTKEDIENLRRATKEDIDNLREDIENLRRTTKEDIEKFKVELKSYMDARIDDMNIRIGDLYGVIKASLVAIVVTLASTILVPLILKIFF